jgi:Tfp pilus assembly protein PilX
MITQNAYAYSTAETDADNNTDSEEFGAGTCDSCGSRIRSKCEQGYDHCVVCSGGVK